MAALISPEIGTVTNQAMKMFLNRRQSTDFLERSQPTATTDPTCHHMITFFFFFNCYFTAANNHVMIKWRSTDTRKKILLVVVDVSAKPVYISTIHVHITGL